MYDDIDFNEIFNDSYAAILEDEISFYALFYQNFIKQSPFIKETFSNIDLHSQGKLLNKAIAHLIEFSFTKKADHYLIDLAKSHKSKLHIDNEMYDLFMNALLLSLKQFYPKFNNNCAVAWRILLAPGIELMKHIPDELT